MGQIIMEQAEVVEGVVDTPPESQPVLGVLVAQSILHDVTEDHTLPGRRKWQAQWTVIHQEFDATISPTSSFETAESLSENVGQALQSSDRVARRLSYSNGVNHPSKDGFER
jgi:hypothetical protein